MKKLLFLCSRNQWRSRTAETIFWERPEVAVDSAGLNNDARVPLGPEQIEWADTILVMEPAHRARLKRKFGEHLAGKRIVVLDIPDNYTYMDPELVEILEKRCAKHLSE